MRETLLSALFVAIGGLIPAVYTLFILDSDPGQAIAAVSSVAVLSGCIAFAIWVNNKCPSVS